ncbi:YceD family protein [Kangiella spongicola]|jgi:uncharacterized protein|uniref:Large ribosomal RNA subunit accumulation protein YceD n=1 Tax=Kangiella spongicola TaxID=796379 RepID=A0A318D793_9GAMM|nr:YceD family protein [Kangiella spongicola]MBV36469.1 hypothetical protein [Rickettsiales bacterium]PXF62727.1 hypothetical protein DL796_10400 [Kangiella spongicola]
MSSRRLPASVDPYKFADQEKEINATLDLEYLSRFRQELASDKGEIACSIKGARVEDTRVTLLELSLKGEVELICQGCLEPFPYQVEHEVIIYPVYSEERMETVPDDGDPVLVDDDGLDLKSVVEDELILSLPPVALYGECKDMDAFEIGELPQESIEEAEKDNPFNALKDLKFD